MKNVNLERAKNAIEMFAKSAPRDLVALNASVTEKLGEDFATLVGFVNARAMVRGVAPEELYLLNIGIAEHAGCRAPDEDPLAAFTRFLERHGPRPMADD